MATITIPRGDIRVGDVVRFVPTTYRQRFTIRVLTVHAFGAVSGYRVSPKTLRQSQRRPDVWGTPESVELLDREEG